MTSAKKILINASMITQQPVGVGVYSIQLLKSLLPLLEEKKIGYVVYTYDKQQLIPLTGTSNIKNISLGLMDKLFLRFLALHRLLWCIFVLPRLALNYTQIYSLSTHGALFNKNQVITIHDLIALSFPAQHKLQFIYFKFLVPVILKNAGKIIAISDFTAKEIARKYKRVEKEKIKVIYNGVNHLAGEADDCDTQIESIIMGRNYCLIVGASYPHKNSSTVLHVAEMLQTEDILFVLVGRSSGYYNRLKTRAKNRNLKNVLFLDYVSRDILSALYRHAKLHLYLSLYEGFGLPPAEAAFYGANSLISDQPALVEVYGHYFKKLNPLDPNAIANAIKETFSSNNENCTHVFKDLVSKYNWEQTATRVSKILEDF